VTNSPYLVCLVREEKVSIPVGFVKERESLDQNQKNETTDAELEGKKNLSKPFTLERGHDHRAPARKEGARVLLLGDA